MLQRQDLELQGSPIVERHAEGQEQRDNDGSYRRTVAYATILWGAHAEQLLIWTSPHRS